ncbi:MAG: BrnT family toxin [Snowella sp.]|nr:BrnT family toxin [Snowella sp.]
MDFNWDNNKNQSNITKHSISFEEAIAIFDDPNILTFEDVRFNYGETRFVSIGQITLVTQEKEVIIVVIHTQRNRAIRLISARKANERERKRYEQQSIFT